MKKTSAYAKIQHPQRKEGTNHDKSDVAIAIDIKHARENMEK